MIKLDVVLDEIDYNEVIDFIVPMLLSNLSKKDNKLGRLFAIVSDVDEITSDMLKAALNTPPQQKKNELIVSILTTYNEDIMKQINKVMDKNDIYVSISQVGIENI